MNMDPNEIWTDWCEKCDKHLNDCSCEDNQLQTISEEK